MDLSSGIYNTHLTRDQVLDHRGWRILIGDDEKGREILDSYSKIVFSEVKRQYRETKAMAFYKRIAIETNELRAPWVYSLGNRSFVLGNDSLFTSASFLRVSQAPQVQ